MHLVSQICCRCREDPQNAAPLFTSNAGMMNPVARGCAVPAKHKVGARAHCTLAGSPCLERAVGEHEGTLAKKKPQSLVSTGFCSQFVEKASRFRSEDHQLSPKKRLTRPRAAHRPRQTGVSGGCAGSARHGIAWNVSRGDEHRIWGAGLCTAFSGVEVQRRSSLACVLSPAAA